MQALEENGSYRTITILDGKNLGAKILLDKDNKIMSANIEDISIFNEIISQVKDSNETNVYVIDGIRYVYEVAYDVPSLIILGGGHVAYAFAPIAKGLDYKVTVCDDRIEFANKERFPDADNIIFDSFENAYEQIPDKFNTYYVIVTRGHKYDNYCLRKSLDRKCAYVGMIGSRSKVKYIKEDLRKDGYSEETINRAHTPIGIDLPGNLPMEVAVSIAAEVTCVRHNEKVSEMDAPIKNYLLNNDKIDAVMATIVKKTGSSPRDIGSKMLIFRDGTILGSVGGGSVEYAAIKEGMKLTSDAINTYDLSNSESATLGMVCGGTIEILFEVIKS